MYKNILKFAVVCILVLLVSTVYVYAASRGQDKGEGYGSFTTDNLTLIDSTGTMYFTGLGGLVFGELYVAGNVTETTISSSGKNNKVQVTNFDTNGSSNNMTPDHTNDHITVLKAGKYQTNVSMHVDSGGGAAAELGFSLYKNNGNTEFGNIHAHRNFAGGGGEAGSLSLSGIMDLAVNDTIELWAWNETNTTNFIVTDADISLIQIGGT